jgi:hypothetical protein
MGERGEHIDVDAEDDIFSRQIVAWLRRLHGAVAEDRMNQLPRDEATY